MFNVNFKFSKSKANIDESVSLLHNFFTHLPKITARSVEKWNETCQPERRRTDVNTGMAEKLTPNLRTNFDKKGQLQYE